MSYEFSSVQVTLSGDIRKQFLHETMRIKSKDLYMDKPGYARETDPHVTVKYGIHTTYPTEIKPLFKGIDEVAFTLGEISTFTSNSDYDVVKIEIIDKYNLKQLNKVISNGTECTDSFKTYHPHATLAYVNKGVGAAYRGKSKLTGRTVTSKSVTFSGCEDNRVELELGYTDVEADTCIGVDFDGTLAMYTGWKGWDHLGKPIPAMVNRVKNWLKEGKNVKLFTARYTGKDRDRILPLFEKWFKAAGLPVLTLTNEKTPGMHEIWDDRAISVIRNRGITKTGHALLEAAVAY